ncbi:MAG: hypothetical protein GF364_11420, partial [Candidatus Lokiarchaeota archaeon]|nr:hypothetical protein [Candidatus Lokiarchaeota archaeon]
MKTLLVKIQCLLLIILSISAFCIFPLSNENSLQNTEIISSQSGDSYQRIFVLGDPHGSNIMPWKYIVSRIDQLDYNSGGLDFVACVGDYDYEVGCSPDVTWKQAEDIRYIFLGENSINAPWFPIYGDHDAAFWKVAHEDMNMPPHSYYYVKDGILHIFLNPQLGQQVIGFLPPMTRHFLNYLLDVKYPNKTTIIYSHLGIEGITPHWDSPPHNKAANYLDFNWWSNFLTNHSNIRAFFAGHTHRSSRSGVQKRIWNNIYFETVESMVACPERAHFLSYSDGYEGEFPLLEIYENKIVVREYSLNKGAFTGIGSTIDGETTLN